MTVLIVDDQINVINGLLNGVHYDELNIDTVLTATSAEEAKNLITDNHIDILMSDVEMPGENGLQLLIIRILFGSFLLLMLIFLTPRRVFGWDVSNMLFNRLPIRS